MVANLILQWACVHDRLYTMCSFPSETSVEINTQTILVMQADKQLPKFSTTNTQFYERHQNVDSKNHK